MHAASTMKVPVMMQLYLDDQTGTRSLDSTLPVKRTFRSIVDGSAYDLPARVGLGHDLLRAGRE